MVDTSTAAIIALAVVAFLALVGILALCVYVVRLTRIRKRWIPHTQAELIDLADDNAQNDTSGDLPPLFLESPGNSTRANTQRMQSPATPRVRTSVATPQTAWAANQSTNPFLASPSLPHAVTDSPKTPRSPRSPGSARHPRTLQEIVHSTALQNSPVVALYPDGLDAMLAKQTQVQPVSHTATAILNPFHIDIREPLAASPAAQTASASTHAERRPIFTLYVLAPGTGMGDGCVYGGMV